MLRHLLIIILLMVNPCANANLYFYPKDKMPQISLKQACEIAEFLIVKQGFGEVYYAYAVSIFGDENQTGAGAWTLMFRNTKGDEIQVVIYFPEDLCVVAGSKDGKFTQKMYKRDGEISKKWLEEKAQQKKEEEESDKFWDSLERQNEEKAIKAEQGAASRPANTQKSKPEGSDKLQPESQPASK